MPCLAETCSVLLTDGGMLGMFRWTKRITAVLFQTSTSASRRPAPSAQRAWMRSTVTGASVRRREAAHAAKKVKPADSLLTDKSSL